MIVFDLGNIFDNWDIWQIYYSTSSEDDVILVFSIVMICSLRAEVLSILLISYLLSGCIIGGYLPSIVDKFQVVNKYGAR